MKETPDNGAAPPTANAPGGAKARAASSKKPAGKRLLSRPPPKRKAWSAVGIAVIALIVTLFAAVSLLGAFFLMYKPSLETEVPFEVTPPSVSAENPAPEPGEPEGEPAAGAFKRNPDMVNILVAGLDAEGENHTDVLILASFDTKAKKIAMMSIPRDTYINVGRNFNKINSYYTGEYNRAILAGKRGEEARRAAMDGLASLVEFNLNVKIDHWAMVNLEGFRNIVDILGGVEIEIAEPMKYSDPDQGLIIDLKPGKQILDGKKSEQFVRFRESYAIPDKGRINAQKVFIAALMSSVKRNLNLSTVAKLAGEAAKNLLTTMNAADIAYYAKEAWSVDMGETVMFTLPGEGVRNSVTGAWYEVMYRADALEIINRHFNVYDTPITDEIFDAGGAFTNKNERYIDDTYRTPKSPAALGSTAGDIESGMTGIQRESFGIFE